MGFNTIFANLFHAASINRSLHFSTLLLDFPSVILRSSAQIAVNLNGKGLHSSHLWRRPVPALSFEDLTGSTITMTYNRILKEMERNKRLKGRGKRLKGSIL
jgi:hypothetical protein